MAEYADARMTADYMDGLADALTIVAFVLGNDKGMAAIIRALTEQARNPKFSKERQHIMRHVAMQLHDNRTINKQWKADLLKATESD